MNLVSQKFIGFSVIVVLIYFMTPQKYKWLTLLAFNIVFYINTGKRAFITLVAVSLFSFCSALLIEKFSEKEKERKQILVISIFLIVMWLVIVKVSELKNWNYRILVTPLGISYISFSLISYLVDVYWGRDTADRNFGGFLCYVMYFPKVIQGPITKHKNLSNQLIEGGHLSYENVCLGIQRMIYGYFKKMVIADRMILFTDIVFADVSQCSGSIILIAIIMAAFQLYCDFSGYMDIILGFTQILGLEMDENFNHPFFSRNAAEFWRRWHMSLGVWFKDYIYTPIAMSHTVKRWGRWGRKKIGKRFGKAVIKVTALSFVWILTGMWHGTGLNYILWGIYWGIIIIGSTVFEPEINKITMMLQINTEAISWRLFQMFRTFALFCIGILLTSVNNLSSIKIAVYKIIYSFNIWELYDGTLYMFGLNKVNFNIVIVSMFVVFLVSLMQEKKSIRMSIAELNKPVSLFIYALSVSLILFLGIYGTGYVVTDFAYAHF